MESSVEIIKELGFVEEFLDITFLDALCYNIDRHTFNFGVIRENGEIKSLAPNFDNNLGLSGVLNDSGLEKTWYSTAFTRYNYIPLLKENDYTMPNVNLESIKVIIKDTLNDFSEIKDKDEFSEIVYKIIENNYNVLKDNLKQED